MMHFLCKLLPPRPSFPHDMTPVEAQLMGEHAAYWTALLDSGVVVAFGPVADPAGLWGLALIEAGSETQAGALTGADPVILADAGFRYDIHPMPDTIARLALAPGDEPTPMREGRP